MRARYLLFAVVVVSCLLTPPAWAGERVIELWRSRYGKTRECCPDTLALNPTDGSVWLVEGATVSHLSAGRSLLFRSEALAADPTDGSCWVVYSGGCTSADYWPMPEWEAILHLGKGECRQPGALSVNAADGSCWVSAP